MRDYRDGPQRFLCGIAGACPAMRDGLTLSVPNGDAGDVGAPQRPAHRFGLIAVEAGETGAEQLPVTFGDDRFGERIGLAEQAVGLVARGSMRSRASLSLSSAPT